MSIIIAYLIIRLIWIYVLATYNIHCAIRHLLQVILIFQLRLILTALWWTCATNLIYWNVIQLWSVSLLIGKLQMLLLLTPMWWEITLAR